MRIGIRRLTAAECMVAPLRLKSPVNVYDLTVAGNSNYFVGSDPSETPPSSRDISSRGTFRSSVRARNAPC